MENKNFTKSGDVVFRTNYVKPKLKVVSLKRRTGLLQSSDPEYLIIKTND